jgi:hypothetical protein
MVRLRNTMIALVLATGVMGCAHSLDFGHWSIFHCSACDDFPMPAYGPGYSMMPGSYAGSQPESTPSSTGTMVPPSSNRPAENAEAAVPATPPASTATPPNPPAADNP